MRRDFFFRHKTAADWEILELTFKEFVDMCAWAFGPTWTLHPQNRLAKLWNDLHERELFKIDGTDEIEETMKRIRDAWRASVR